MGGANNPSVLQAERKDEYGAEAAGMEGRRLPEPPISVTDWSPYIEEVQSKGVEAVWPSPDDNIVPYFQAMTTAGYHPAFVILGVQFYNSTTTQGSRQASTSRRSTSRRRGGLSRWPRRTRRQSSSSRSCTRTPRATPSTSTTRRVRSRGSLGEVRLRLWRQPDGVLRAQPRRRHEELGRRRHSGTGGAVDHRPRITRQPSPCFALLKAEPNKFVYDKAITQPTQSIWNCNPKNVVHLTPQQQASLTGSS